MWFRVQEDDRKLINAAAALLGMTTTDFCAFIITHEAKRTFCFKTAKDRVNSNDKA